jgi:hypothetical protein
MPDMEAVLIMLKATIATAQMHINEYINAWLLMG